MSSAFQRAIHLSSRPSSAGFSGTAAPIAGGASVRESAGVVMILHPKEAHWGVHPRLIAGTGSACQPSGLAARPGTLVRTASALDFGRHACRTVSLRDRRRAHQPVAGTPTS